jgi:Stress responsive A/B Barrel Domain
MGLLRRIGTAPAGWGRRGPRTVRPAQARWFRRPTLIAHVVLFEPKQNVPAESRKAFLDEIRSVARTIPTIVQARIGSTISVGVMPEEIIGQKTYKAYTYAAIFEFTTREDLEGYLTHSVHDKLRSIFWDLCQATLIADVELFDPVSIGADGLV